MSKLTILLLAFSFSFTSHLYCQDDEFNIYEVEKISIEMGFGLHNGVAGIRGKYFFHDYLGCSLGIGSLGSGLLWNVSLEVRTPDLLTPRFSPFFNVMYGTNSAASLSVLGGEPIEPIFNGFSTGVGLKLNLIPKYRTYLSIGVNYRIIGSDRGDFIYKFNQDNGTNFNTDISKVFPACGVTYCFK